jgi:glucuronokinase
VPARAALAGNPSDRHGGAVVAVPVGDVTATVTLRPADRFDVVATDPTGRPRASDAAADADDLRVLVEATIRSAVRHAAMPADLVDDVEVGVATTIPRSVGLAGSSAIVIALLRGLRALDPDAAWSRRLGDPDAEAVVALEAERTEMGIAAGLQDRLVQAHGRPLLMEFDAASTRHVLGLPCGRSTPLPDPPGRLVVASRTAVAESSGVLHHDLDARRDENASTMADLAATARRAAVAIREGDHDELAEAIDTTMRLRGVLYELDPELVEMVEVARAAGAAANSTGSGGSIVALCRDDAHADVVARGLRGIAGCVVLGDARRS